MLRTVTQHDSTTMKTMLYNRFTIKINLFAIILALLFPLHSEAQTQLMIEWLPLTASNIAGYRVYGRMDGEFYDYNVYRWEGIETSCVINVDDETLPHYFIIHALTTEGEQGPVFNEVCWGCDLCPNDPYKTVPGVCGCGVPDTDIDADGNWDCFDIDDDNDGIDDIIEHDGPNQGDSNLDGVLDSLQGRVGSIPVNRNMSHPGIKTINEDTRHIAIESSEGTRITGFKRVETSSLPEMPPEINLVFGLYEFGIINNGVNEIVTVKITLPENATPNTFYKYGMTPDNQYGHWYEFADDGKTGVDINGNIITLYFVDALRGDRILYNDYMLTGPDGPGFILNVSNNISDSTYYTESDAGCFIEGLFR